MVEWWNDGMMGVSNIPILQYSIVYVFLDWTHK